MVLKLPPRAAGLNHDPIALLHIFKLQEGRAAGDTLLWSSVKLQFTYLPRHKSAGYILGYLKGLSQLKPFFGYTLKQITRHSYTKNGKIFFP